MKTTEIKLFNLETCPTVRSFRQEPKLRFQADGQIQFNRALMELMKLAPGDGVQFFDANGDIYVVKSESEKAFILKNVSSGGGGISPARISAPKYATDSSAALQQSQWFSLKNRTLRSSTRVSLHSMLSCPSSMAFPDRKSQPRKLQTLN